MSDIKCDACSQSYAVKNPRIMTDKSVDCSSIDSIIKCLIKDGMTEEEKVLSLFHWVRRMIYHGDTGCKELEYDIHFMINVSGNGSCLRQTTVLALLLDRIGIKSESWIRTFEDHHLMQIQYDGDWHCFDPHMNFYVYDRSPIPKIASIKQLQDDPSLALDAASEGRAGKGWLLCKDSPSVFAGPGDWHYDGKFPEGFARPVIKEPFGNIALRRGETYIRTWMPGQYWFKRNSWMKDSGTYHTCLEGDRLDSANWSLYEPHGWEVKELGALTYRHWGAGKLVYQPAIENGHYLDSVTEYKNLKPGKDSSPLLAPANPGQPAEIVFTVNCPYVMTAGELCFDFKGMGSIEASISKNDGSDWIPVNQVVDGNTFNAVYVDEINGCFNRYLIKLTLLNDVEITKISVVTHFQLNPYSLPHLTNGKNVISVKSEQYNSPLKVMYKWKEGDNWTDEKTAACDFYEDGTMEIDVGGSKYPHMEELVLSVAP